MAPDVSGLSEQSCTVTGGYLDLAQARLLPANLMRGKVDGAIGVSPDHVGITALNLYHDLLCWRFAHSESKL